MDDREKMKRGNAIITTMRRLFQINSPLQAYLSMMGFTLFCIIIETGMLILLPRLQLSFGPLEAPIFLFSATHIGFLIFAIFLLGRRKSFSSAIAQRFSILICSLQFALTILAFYGLYIEPFHLTVTRLHLASAQFFPDRPIRILQISDLHVERITPRERDVIARAELLHPDVIVLTGDYLNIDYNTDPTAIQDARLVLSKLHAPFGIYAVLSSPGVDRPDSMAAIFDGLPIRILNGAVEKLSFPLSDLYIVGVPNIMGAEDAGVLQQCVDSLPPDAYKLLLYHTPDLIEAASAAGVNLYLAGHTHGGQVRLPIYGAIVTFSAYGKQYEGGKYTLGKTTLYVSRGLGMEGVLPRMRFLAPPELVLVELGK